MVALDSHIDSDDMLYGALILVGSPFIGTFYVLHAFSSWINLFDDACTLPHMINLGIIVFEFCIFVWILEA